VIEVFGADGSSEKDAALKIAEDLLTLWPDLKTNEDSVKIYAGAKLFGYPVQDVDIILACNFKESKKFSPIRPVNCQGDGGVEKREIYVDSLLACIEVKDHSGGRVRFEGDAAFVQYVRGNSAGWHPASDQSLAQLHSLKSFFQNELNATPFVINLIYFTNLESSDLPIRPNNFVPSNISPKDLLTVIAEVQKPYRKKNGKCYLSVGPGDLSNRINKSKIFSVLTPSDLDRKKLDAISLNEGFNPLWTNELGKRFLILRGKAGTGKTIALLQIANNTYLERASRCLILTYNLALVSEIRRILILLNLPVGVDDGGVKIDSAMSFFWALCRDFGLLPDEYDDNNFESVYRAALCELAESFEKNIFSVDEINEVILKYPDKFAFDYVLVDESQDWLAEEIAIIKTIFNYKNIVISDGVDQLVRGRRSSWTIGIKESERAVFSLERSLRLKTNLVYFVNQLALLFDYPDWSIKANAVIKGGQVIVFVGKFWSSSSMVKDCISTAKAQKNSPIDLLMFLPPSKVSEVRSAEGSARFSELVGGDYWSGFDVNSRKSGASNLNALRLMSYNSARGLEGWSVFCMGFDEFCASRIDISNIEYDSLADPQLPREEWVDRELSRWILMILTRAVDTLFIQIDDENSFAYKKLRILAERMPDVVIWKQEK
jgi:hypothetical protein